MKKVADEINNEISPLQVAYLNFVKGELVRKGSLQHVRVQSGELFAMHPLIREFIQNELKAKEEDLTESESNRSNVLY